jgi:hypothetical protein
MQDQATGRVNGSRQIVEAGKQVAQDAETLGGSVNVLVDRARESVTGFMVERPYVTVAAAVGIGYLLAGGFASRLTRLALGIGGRLVMQRAVAQVLAGVGEEESF